MWVVYKYQLQLGFGGPNQIDLPVGSKVLHAGKQSGQMFLWALQPSNSTATEKRVFVILGTGHPFAEGPDHEMVPLNTIIDEEEHLVWHVFELVER